MIALVVGALLVLWQLAAWDAKVSQRDQEAIQGAQEALALSQPFHRQVERLANASRRAQERATMAQERAAGLTRELGRLRTALPPNDTTPIRRATVDSLLAVAELRDSARVEQISALSMAMAAERARADAAVARVASLEASLRGVLQVATCHMLGVGWLPRCPSRNASLLLGAGLGASVVLLNR